MTPTRFNQVKLDGGFEKVCLPLIFSPLWQAKSPTTPSLWLFTCQDFSHSALSPVSPMFGSFCLEGGGGGVRWECGRGWSRCEGTGVGAETDWHESEEWLGEGRGRVSPTEAVVLSFTLCLSVCLSIYLSACLPVCLSVSITLCLSVSVSLCLSVSVCLSAGLSLSVCLSRVRACLCVCVCVVFGRARAAARVRVWGGWCDQWKSRVNKAGKINTQGSY